jgi:ubiquinone/menaquinone biosynthesis C-methylase UbiE
MDERELSWDYTSLADAYVHRPQYAESVVDAVISRAGLTPTDPVVDIGAGTGNLTTLFLQRGFKVDAVEPNAAMRRHGIAQTERFGGAVNWVQAVAECTGLPRGIYALVTFGSSFNVVDTQTALEEAAAVLRPQGWLMCCWNHRDVEDSLQRAIEEVIQSYIPDYRKGARAGDQSQVIADSRLFEPAQFISGRVIHRVRTSEWVTAWRSHATLARQAGNKLEAIVADIAAMLDHLTFVDVPYITNSWLARCRHAPR